MDEQKKYPRFLSNDPCGEDLFEGHSHRNIAQSIASLLKSNDHNHVIGIEGGWGSGKSNMVKLVQKKLEQDDDNQFHFFIYDAWGHQTDTLRRSILEELTVFLVGDDSHNEVTEGILMDHSGKWKEWKKHLLSKRRHIKQKTIKELNPFLVVGAFFAPFIPVFNTISHFITSDIGSLIYWFSILILVFSIAIVIYKKQMKKYEQKFEFKKAFKELFKLYLDYKNKDNDDKNVEALEKHTTIYEEETSSRDFRFWVNEINNDLGKQDLKLVIVFDNMDRLPKDKVQELWAVIHTLFAEKNFSNIHVIVPFDREHVQSAFRAEDIIGPSSNNNTESQKKKQSFGDDFINKTFDVVYRVAPPIMSDWKSYFECQWEKAFGKNEKPGDDVIQIIDSLMGTPSPRELIAFINEFVSIRQSLQENIPDKYIAFFILGKNTIRKNPCEEIISPTYLKNLNYSYKHDTDLPKYISALYFQLPSEKAIEIVYIEALKNALDNADRDFIKTIEKRPSFKLLLERALDNVSNIRKVIISISVLESPNEQIWNHVYHRYKSLNTVEAHTDDFHGILMKHVPNKGEFVTFLAEKFANYKKFDALTYYNSIQNLVRMFREATHDYDSRFHLPQKEILPKEFLSFISNINASFYEYDNLIICDEALLTEHLLKLSIDELKEINLSIIKSTYSYSNCILRYIKYLESLINTSLDINRLEVLYAKLKEVQCPIVTLPKDEVLLRCLSDCEKSRPFYYDLCCMAISRLNNANPSDKYSYKSILESEGEDFFDHAAKVIEYYMNYNDLILLALEYSPIKELAQKVTEDSSLYLKNRTLNILPLLMESNSIITDLGINLNRMLDKLSQLERKSYYMEKQITKDNVMDIPIEFFESTKESDHPIVRHCRRMCIEALMTYDYTTFSIDDMQSNIILLAPFLKSEIERIESNGWTRYTKDQKYQEVVTYIKNYWDDESQLTQ